MPPPGWALEAIDGFVDGDPADRWVPSLRAAIEAQVAEHFPGTDMRSLPAELAVVLEWTGDPAALEVVDALGLGFAYEDRGLMRASIDSLDTVGWPPELDLVDIVLKRHDP